MVKIHHIVWVANTTIFTRCSLFQIFYKVLDFPPVPDITLKVFLFIGKIVLSARRFPVFISL